MSSNHISTIGISLEEKSPSVWASISLSFDDHKVFEKN